MSEEIKTFTDLLGGLAEGIPGLHVTEKRPNPNGKGGKIQYQNQW